MQGHHRRRLATIAVAGVAAVFVLTMSPALASSPAHTSVSGSVTPIVECTAKRNGANHTVFGYRNTGPATTVSVGAQNRFAPGTPDRGQPTTFESGTHINVFSVTAADALTWTLGGQQVQAPHVLCQTGPAGSALAGWGPIGGLVIVTGLLGTMLFWRSHRARVRVR